MTRCSADRRHRWRRVGFVGAHRSRLQGVQACAGMMAVEAARLAARSRAGEADVGGENRSPLRATEIFATVVRFLEAPLSLVGGIVAPLSLVGGTARSGAGGLCLLSRLCELSSACASAIRCSGPSRGGRASSAAASRRVPAAGRLARPVRRASAYRVSISRDSVSRVRDAYPTRRPSSYAFHACLSR